jgi:hypothetical protein
MPHTSRNFVVAYILLVGLPLLGLAGVLRTGRSLSAPISVGGVWKPEANSGNLSSHPCDKTLSFLVNSSWAISQSGKSVVLSFDDPTRTIMSGALEGKALRASAVSARDPKSNSGCRDDQRFTMIATVDPSTEPRSLTGRVAVDGCEACAPLEFHAVRQPRATGGEAH